MSGQPDQFADELRLIAGGLEGAAAALRKDADRAQEAADEFDRVVEERDELRDEVARMRRIMAEVTRPVFSPQALINAAYAFREGGGS